MGVERKISRSREERIVSWTVNYERFDAEVM
jgi:hypothetical protein